MDEASRHIVVMMKIIKSSQDDPLLIKKNLFCYRLVTDPILQHFGPAYCTRVQANCPIYELAQGCCTALSTTLFKKVGALRSSILYNEV